MVSDDAYTVPSGTKLSELTPISGNQFQSCSSILCSNVNVSECQRPNGNLPSESSTVNALPIASLTTHLSLVTIGDEQRPPGDRLASAKDAPPTQSPGIAKPDTTEETGDLQDAVSEVRVMSPIDSTKFGTIRAPLPRLSDVNVQLLSSNLQIHHCVANTLSFCIFHRLIDPSCVTALRSAIYFLREPLAKAQLKTLTRELQLLADALSHASVRELECYAACFPLTGQYLEEMRSFSRDMQREADVDSDSDGFNDDFDDLDGDSG